MSVRPDEIEFAPHLPPVPPPRLSGWEPVEQFAGTVEQGAEPLVGDVDAALVPSDGDIMFYGDGGAGKTTLAIDKGYHLAAGVDWLGVRVGRAVNVGLVENEGPRPLFRRKLARKSAAWEHELQGRIHVLAEPWAQLVLDEDRCRAELAAAIRGLELGVVIIGPLSHSGMTAAGTLDEVREFKLLLGDVRALADRPVCFALIHHENRAHGVSGRWEPNVETLFHVTAQGHGRTRLYVQKARWSSVHHQTSMQLAWTEGEGFELVDKPERDDNALTDELLEAALAHGGASWNAIDDETGGRDTRKRAIRDRLLAGGRLVNTGSGRKMELWHADDPALPAVQAELRPDGDAPGTHPAAVGP